MGVAATVARRLTLRAAGRAIGLDAAEVSEVARLAEITPVPLAPPALLGLASVRGRVAPVVSLAVLLGEPKAAGRARRMVVLRRAQPIALAVEEVDAAGEAEGQDADLGDLDALLAQAFASSRRLQAKSPDRASPTAAPARREIGVLSFRIAGQAYGLPLANVREVFRAPGDLLRLQNADEVALGVVERHGGVLAIVSPAPLLGLDSAGVGERPSVVVAGLGGASVGLLVDVVRSVLRVPEDELRPVPAVLNRGRGEGEVQAIARTAEGLVALLSPERLFEHRTVAAALAQTPTEAAPMLEAAANDANPFVIFRLGEQSFGLPAGAVVEVVNAPEALQPAPAASRTMAGVMSHRGAALPVIDPAERLGLTSSAARRRVVVLASPSGVRCGLIVDAVEQLVRVEASRLTETTELAEEGARIFHRAAIVELDGRPVLFVDPQALLDDAERELAASVKGRRKAGDA